MDNRSFFAVTNNFVGQKFLVFKKIGDINENKFGFLAKLEFLQTISSSLMAALNPAMIHNLEKYYILKKVHYLSAIENVEGDYLGFGVFTGSSFCHAIRCLKKQNILIQL